MINGMTFITGGWLLFLLLWGCSNSGRTISTQPRSVYPPTSYEIVNPSAPERVTSPGIYYPRKQSPYIARSVERRPVIAAPVGRPSSLSRFHRNLRIKKDILRVGSRSRPHRRPMSPRYITIHSTQNWSKGADAYRHALALKRGKLGSLSWHYTVDQNVIIQHLPTREQGKHADINGPGNKYSIGIEMCEHPGNSRSATLERTAKLTAYLMKKHQIPLRRVVPHYHWPRRGYSPAHKNCPHFLLENGRPGRKWKAYLKQINKHYQQIK